MKPIEGWDLISESGELKNLTAGIYGLVITDVIDFPEEDKQYFEVYFDIAKGEFKDYYKLWKENDGKDHSKTVRSYKEKALRFFKGFITAIEKSNPNYKWDWDEKKLKGKFVIGVFGEEEYINSDGQVAVIVRLQEFRSVESFKAGELKVPPRKCLSEEEKAKARTASPQTNEAAETLLTSVSDDDLPF